MLLAVRRSHLVCLESGLEGLLLSSSVTAIDPKPKQTFQNEKKKNKKTKSSDLECKIDQLSSTVEILLPFLAKVHYNMEVQEKAQIESCITPLPPMHTGQEFDVMSVAASDSLFEATPVMTGAEEKFPADKSLHSGSEMVSKKLGGSSSVVASLEGTLKTMLAHINLDPLPPRQQYFLGIIFLRCAQREHPLLCLSVRTLHLYWCQHYKTHQKPHTLISWLTHWL